MGRLFTGRERALHVSFAYSAPEAVAINVHLFVFNCQKSVRSGAQRRGITRHTVSSRKEGAGEAFFLTGMTRAMHRLVEQALARFRLRSTL